MQKEKNIQNEIRLNCSNAENRIFRNHVGAGFSPESVHSIVNMVTDPKLKKRMKTTVEKGYQKFGFGKGSSDLIGIQSQTITADMVGKKMGVFFAIEVKDSEHKTDQDLLAKQQNYIDLINNLGGNAGFASSVDEANSVIHRRI